MRDEMKDVLEWKSVLEWLGTDRVQWNVSLGREAEKDAFTLALMKSKLREAGWTIDIHLLDDGKWFVRIIGDIPGQFARGEGDSELSAFSAALRASGLLKPAYSPEKAIAYFREQLAKDEYRWLRDLGADIVQERQEIVLGLGGYRECYDKPHLHIHEDKIEGQTSTCIVYWYEGLDPVAAWETFVKEVKKVRPELEAAFEREHPKVISPTVTECPFGGVYINDHSEGCRGVYITNKELPSLISELEKLKGAKP